MKPIKHSWKRLFIGAIVSASITALVACGGSSGSSGAAANTGPVYTAIFDAGSSGTRVSLYKVIPGNGGYPEITLLDGPIKYGDDGINDFLGGNGTSKGGMITLTEYDSKTGRLVNVLPGGVRPDGCNGGVDQTDSDGAKTVVFLGQNDVGPCVIQPLLNALNPDLTKYGIARPQIKTELFATAGMRTEDKRNGGTFTTEQITAFYAKIKAYAVSMSFDTGEYKTINGNSEEGVWTWTNLNDLYNNIFNNPASTTVMQSPVGDFEVGGSSMQIAFPLAAGTPTSDATNTYPVKINGKTFSVYSKTFLGFGGDDARKYVRAQGYGTGSFNGGAECYTSGATPANSAETSGIALYPSSTWITTSVGLSDWQVLLPANLSLLANNTAGYIFNTCTTKFNTIINQVTSLARNNDGTDNLGATATMATLKSAVNRSTAPFVGVDGFYFSANFLNLDSPTAINPATFQSTLQTTCAVPENSSKTRDQANCAQATYMNTFLWGSNGLFTNNSSATFQGVIPPSAAGKTLTWTRGYLLLKYAN
ncbi:hypothetical protein ICN18_09370 [Polynucleobacter sp. Ross1-W9]|uniref:hypothetical protein n=1 Tax=Polynucleobacter parvulilacunae TaxID=1855631 RepID=UPI001C0AF3BE|nr:hypothetical protein [Polynucleobacter parvulilacunae]MBU3557838.1 hypothetical protein [Polynucleobacter parvulilacunae]